MERVAQVAADRPLGHVHAYEPHLLLAVLAQGAEQAGRSGRAARGDEDRRHACASTHWKRAGPSGSSMVTTSSRVDPETRFANEPQIDHRREAREERLGTEPLTRPARQVRRAEHCEEPAAGREPAVDLAEQRREKVARHVVEGVERGDRIEGSGRQLELGDVGADELGHGNRGSRTFHLQRRDVHARHREALGEPSRLRRSAAAADLEHARAVRKTCHELVLPLAAWVADDLLPPGGESLTHRVIAVRDDLRSGIAHGAMVLLKRALDSRSGEAARLSRTHDASRRRPRRHRPRGRVHRLADQPARDVARARARERRVVARLVCHLDRRGLAVRVALADPARRERRARAARLVRARRCSSPTPPPRCCRPRSAATRRGSTRPRASTRPGRPGRRHRAARAGARRLATLAARRRRLRARRRPLSRWAATSGSSSPSSCSRSSAASSSSRPDCTRCCGASSRSCAALRLESPLREPPISPSTPSATRYRCS